MLMTTSCVVAAATCVMAATHGVGVDAFAVGAGARRARAPTPGRSGRTAAAASWVRAAEHPRAIRVRVRGSAWLTASRRQSRLGDDNADGSATAGTDASYDNQEYHPQEESCIATCSALTDSSGPHNTQPCDSHPGCVFNHGDNTCISMVSYSDNDPVPCPPEEHGHDGKGIDCNAPDKPNCSDMFKQEHPEAFDADGHYIYGYYDYDSGSDDHGFDAPGYCPPYDGEATYHPHDDGNHYPQDGTYHPYDGEATYHPHDDGNDYPQDGTDHPYDGEATLGPSCIHTCSDLTHSSGPDNTGPCDAHPGCVFNHGDNTCISIVSFSDHDPIPCPDTKIDGGVKGVECNAPDKPTCYDMFKEKHPEAFDTDGHYIYGYYGDMATGGDEYDPQAFDGTSDGMDFTTSSMPSTYQPSDSTGYPSGGADDGASHLSLAAIHRTARQSHRAYHAAKKSRERAALGSTREAFLGDSRVAATLAGAASFVAAAGFALGRATVRRSESLLTRARTKSYGAV